MGGIFISYRRDDSQGFAGRLEHDLAQCFGDDLVFRDREIPPGADFADHIEHQLRAADASLVVIGRHWLDIQDASGARRLDQPGDWVRREIEWSLSSGMPVIPLLVAGVPMPTATQLPGSLQGLARFQALSLSDHRWPDDMRALCDALSERVPRLAKARAQSARPAAKSREPAAPARRALPSGFVRWLSSLLRRVAGLVALGAAVYIGVRALGGPGANRVMGRLIDTTWQEIQRLF
ncbi:toll/interleukin-1 receptor domain-containing protein [Hydrogenophaga sp.]|uniref:toll/interleukin-1 receptor domain-containing protein n=1 Tax=Hydrogenophaga sp. TaxID=1904254 RepID=UPI0025BCB573|nr:toll/interleukin-1 receptor domain-containing protein [Hydrogenophaga sp.]